MKFGKVITAAAASGVLLSGAFMIAEEYTGHSAFAVTLSDNTKVDVKAKKGTVREILAANNISYNADDRVEPGLDTKLVKSQFKMVKQQQLEKQLTKKSKTFLKN